MPNSSCDTSSLITKSKKIDTCEAFKKFKDLNPGIIPLGEKSKLYYKLLSDCINGR